MNASRAGGEHSQPVVGLCAFRSRSPPTIVSVAFRHVQEAVAPAPVPTVGELVPDVLDTLPAGVVVAEADGTVLLANPAARALGIDDRGGRLSAALAALVAQVSRDGEGR